ncbi:MAG: ABC transporter substrate-binding protein, partial [Chloroflexota bacterium]
DVAYTWATNIKYGTAAGVSYQDYIVAIEAVDPHTVRVRAKLDGTGQAVNPLMVSAYLSSNYVIQKAWTQTLEARTGYDAEALKADPGLDFVASGPYMNYYVDNNLVVLIRDEDYWGQDDSMWGKLPAPKFLAHTIFAETNSGFNAFKAGEVDINQQFIKNVQDLWLVERLPISTYFPDAPYMVPASLPTAYYNLNSYGLDNVAIRKAIAIATDYDAIISKAMTNQSPTFNQVPRSVMSPIAHEQSLYSQTDVASLQWTGKDIQGAKNLLNDAGIVDTNGDGWRELAGKKLTYKAVCPNGWADWQPAIEIIAEAGGKIGIDIQAYFPDWSEYSTIFTDGTQTEYDIFMVWSNAAGPASPWGRVRQLMSSEFVGWTNNWSGNWGGYVNPRIDEIIAEIPGETDLAQLKVLYTEATEIYLTDVPSFTVMYRPDQFYVVNEKVWTNFPHHGDGTNPRIPPLTLTDGWSIAGLYNITLTKHIVLPILLKN